MSSGCLVAEDKSGEKIFSVDFFDSWKVIGEGDESGGGFGRRGVLLGVGVGALRRVQDDFATGGYTARVCCSTTESVEVGGGELTHPTPIPSSPTIAPSQDLHTDRPSPTLYA